MNTHSCGKVGYPSQAAARRAAISAQARTGDRLRNYHCPNCHRWHLTSAPPLPAPPVRRRKRRHTREPQQPTPATPAEVDAWFAQHGKAQSQ